MKQIISLSILSLISVCLVTAQNTENDYRLDNRVFIYDVINFDSLVVLKKNNVDYLVCIEKKEIDYYANRDSIFYVHWELYPNSYKLVSPGSVISFMNQYVFPYITDTALTQELSDCCITSEGYPKHILEYDFTMHHRFNKNFYNLSYFDVGRGTFLVLLVPYKLFYQVFDMYNEYEPSQKCKMPLLTEQYTPGLFIKVLYPMYLY